MTDGQSAHHRPSTIDWLALVAILISAFALRFHDVNWDSNRFLHPDELFVTIRANDQIHFDQGWDWETLSNPDTSPINPRSRTCGDNICNYSYGALPLIITDFAAEVLMTNVVGEEWSDFDHIPRVGRTISAAIDTITVLLIFLIAARLFGAKPGLLAAAIYAGTPLAIQLSHFFTTDIWLACFVALTIWTSLIAFDKERHGWFVLAGASFGFALATKGSILFLSGAVAMAAILVAWKTFNREDPAGAVANALSRMLVAGIAALAAFALFEPYALMRASVFIDQLQEQQMMSSGEIDFPYTRRYVGTTPILYQLEQLGRWGLGPGAFILAGIGVLLMFWWLFRRRHVELAIPLTFLVLQGAVIMLPQVKFLRYQIPVVPILAVAGGVAIWTGYSWLSRKLNRGFGGLFVTACLVAIALWTTAFMSIYEGDHPRVAASKWIYANVPMGSTILGESWDDDLPLGFGPMMTFDDLQYQRLPNIDEDSENDIVRSSSANDIYGDRPPAEVSDYLFNQLSSTDYYVTSSNRLRASVAQLPWRYPVQIAFYDLLDSGALGFEPVADFQTKPHIGDYSIDDGLADESWVNYDHPRVQIYEKVDMVDRETWDALFAPYVEQEWIPTRLNEQEKSLLLDEPVGELDVVDNYRWSEEWTSNSGIALLVWIGLLVLLGVVGRQWVRTLFPRFPDGGQGLARILTVVLAGWALWFLSSWKIISFTVVWSWITLGAMAALGLVLWLLLADRRRSFPGVAIAGSEIAFWSVFALFLLFRWINPDSYHPIWGGEKPMEFAHLNATLRSAHFPPFDPWFADGYINYYYYGLYLVAYCIKLVGIPAEIAFNLAQPTIMGLMASGVYTVSAALSSKRSKASMAVATGLAATLLVVLIGNLVDFTLVVKAWPDAIEPSFGDWTWNPSRALGGSTITEFPFFTGLYADLHAHGINVPITMCVLALCITLARDPWLTLLALKRPTFGKDFLGLLVRLAVLAVALGSVATTNSWDLAEYVAFLGVAVFMSLLWVQPFLLRAALTVAFTGAVGVATYIAFFPFYKYYVALFTSIGETREKTDVISFAGHFGGLLAIVGVGLIALLVALLRDRTVWVVTDPVLPLTLVGVALLLAVATNWDLEYNTFTVKLAVLVCCLVLMMPIFFVIDERAEDWVQDLAKGSLIAVMVLVGVLATDGRGVLALMISFFTTGAALWLFADDRGERFTGAIVACATGIVGVIEIVYLQDNLSGIEAYRMNTVFKFYNQVWVLLGIAGAVAIGKALEGSGWLAWLTGDSVDWTDEWDEAEEPAETEPNRFDDDDWDEFAYDDSTALARYQDDGGYPVLASSTGEESDDMPSNEDEHGPANVPPVSGGAHDPNRESDEYGQPIDRDSWAAYEPPHLIEDEIEAEEHGEELPEPYSIMRTRWFKIVVIIAVIAIILSLFYPVLATAPRLNERFGGHPGANTLNAYDWMTYGTIIGGNGDEISFEGDHEAIMWLIEHVEGTPVIMEASIGAYRGNGSRISINTGLPTVIGWAGHESQQRWSQDIGPREEDVRNFYSSDNTIIKRAILDKYMVEYVIVGDVERYTGADGVYWADPRGIETIEQMVGTDLEVAFESGGTTVYRVVR